VVFGSIAAKDRGARSAAEMPGRHVALGIDRHARTAVPTGVVLDETASGMSNSSSRCPVIDRQICPRPCLAMKLIACGRALRRRHGQVAFVLAIFVVNDDDHAAGLR
jgi:hypothetical protein